MQQYKWSGIDKDGNKKTGHSLARSEEHLKALLLQKNVALLKSRKRLFVITTNKVSLENYAFFFEDLSDLLSCGIPLLTALQLTQKNSHSQQFKEIIEILITAIANGNSLSSSMEQCSAFSSVLVQTTRAGELSGKLNIFLKNISEHLHSKAALTKDLKRASLLPAITLAFSFIIVLLLFTLVIPQFVPLFGSIEKKLPTPTRILLSISDWLTNLPFFYLPGLISLPFAVWVLSKNHLNKFLEKIPFIGSTILLSDQHSFFQSLTLLLKSGCPLLNSITTAIGTISNEKTKIEFAHIAMYIEQGNSFYDSFVKSKIAVPEHILALIELGEKTGKLELSVEKATSLLEKKLKAKIQIFSTILQPILLLFLGCFIALLIYSLYIPLFDAALCFS